jgi:hypothetical protein
MENKPVYVIEESFPRFSGIDSMVLASVTADKFNQLDNSGEHGMIGGHYILAKESYYNNDYLFLRLNKCKDNACTIITLLSEEAFDRKRIREEKRMKCDDSWNLLWDYYANQYQIYVTPTGFTDYFKIKTLESEIGIEYKKRYGFDKNKLNINRGYKIKSDVVPCTYGILNKINPEYLEFTTIEKGGFLGTYKLLLDYVLNGTIEIEAVDL